MKFKVLILLALLSVYSLSLIGVYGGEEATEHIYLTIPFLKMDLSLLLNDRYCPVDLHFCLGDTINISNELRNTGTINATGNLSTSVMNTSDNELQRDDWFYVNVSAGNTSYYNTSYMVRPEDEIGIFNVNSAYLYDGNSSVANCSFWVYKGIGNLSVSGLPIFTIAPGQSGNQTLWLWERFACDNVIVRMNASLGEPGNWTSFGPEEILLTPGTINQTEVIVTVPGGTDYGNYYGWVYANADGQQRPINLTVIVAVDRFYLNTTIPPDKKQVCQGDYIYAEVNITKLIPGRIDVNMTYQILYNGTVLDEIKETLMFNDTFNSTIRVPVLRVPSDAELDYHAFLSILQNNETLLGSSDIFEVISCPVIPTPEAGPGGPIVPQPSPVVPVKGLQLNLSTDLLSVITGNRTSFVATVGNTGTQSVKSVKISIEGIPLDWIDIIPASIDIPVGGTQGYLVTINVPKDAEIGVYTLKVKATNDVDSNTEILTLVIGKNLKQIADLLLEQYNEAKALAEQALLIEDCLDVTIIKIIHKDAEYAYKRGLEEYEKENYAKTINWLEYAIPLERKVVSRVDIDLEMELRASNASKIIIPPFYEAEDQFSQAHIYFAGKNYEEICDPIEEIRKFIMVGLIFWPIIMVIIVLLVVIIIIFYRRKRKEERAGIMERLRERLGKPEEKT